MAGTAALGLISAGLLAPVVGGSSPDGPRGAAVAAHGEHAASSAALHPGSRLSAAETSAADLSLQLQALLGQHSLLAAEMMRSRVKGTPDFAQAANAALGKNTEAMSEVVASLFGAQAKAGFAPTWGEHVTALFDYARGLADDDDAVRANARKKLIEYEGDLARFFAAASQGRLKAADAEAAVRVHVDHLLHQADAYAAGDYARADQLNRVGYSHMFALGKVLASTLLPADAAKNLDTPIWRLRSELGRLLGEHVDLAVGATRSAVAEPEGFGAAAAALDANTRSLAGAVDTLFGPAAARQFQSLWADHVDALVAYTSGVAKQDRNRRADAVRRLRTFEPKLAAFLAAGTGNRMVSAKLAKALGQHDQMLLNQVDAYAAEQYREAHDIAYLAYQAMFELSRGLADAIGAEAAAKLPRGGPETGMGGMSDVVGRR